MASSNYTPRYKARLGIVILNYRTPRLVIDCLDSLANQLEGVDARIVVVDNHSNDGSADEIAAHLAQPGLAERGYLIRSKTNTGFSGGNNIGIQCLDSEFYLLMNSDTVARPNFLEAIVAAIVEDDIVGALGPRLEDPDGTPQISCFRHASPLSEFLATAHLSWLDPIFQFAQVAIPAPTSRRKCDWVSFGCVILRRAAVEQSGLLDDGYFMYFEDSDYCRTLSKNGWKVVYDPTPRVVHFRGGSSPVKSNARAKKRLPAYYYASRTRYFRKTYGLAGPLLANIAWLSGRLIAQVRSFLGKPVPILYENQITDMWINWRSPLGDPHAPMENQS